MWQVVSDTMSPQVSAIARGRPDDSRQWQTAMLYTACDAEASQPRSGCAITPRWK
jgi:hypothetical protein